MRSNLNSDRGVHICKSMIGYEKFGNGKTPESEGKKSDHFVGDYYVRFNVAAKKNPKLEKEALECLKKWEAGDKDVIALWKKMNKWAYRGWAETYKLFGIGHDVEYYESEIYEKGRDIIMGGLKKGIFEKGRLRLILRTRSWGRRFCFEAMGRLFILLRICILRC